MRKPYGLRPIAGVLSYQIDKTLKKTPLAYEASFLTKEAAESFIKTFMQVLDLGGRLVVLDMWRNTNAQMKAWLDYQTRRKTIYSPPPGWSMHELGRAIDLDLRIETTKIDPERIAAILTDNAWVTTQLHKQGQLPHWHWEFRDPLLTSVHAQQGYAEMLLLARTKNIYKPPQISDMKTDALEVDTWT